ncbi:transposase [Sinorhizobium fredii]
MGSAILLRDDFDGRALRQLARQTKDANQARRLLALAEIYDGGSRSDAARIGSVTLQIVRDWVLRFNARGPDGLVNGKAPGGRAKLNVAQRHALAKIVESGPIPAIHGVVRWRRKDLVRWIFQEFRIAMDETTVGRELKKKKKERRSASPSCRPARATTPRTSWRQKLLKRLPRRSGGNPRPAPARHRPRALVGRRSAHRPEEQDHAAVGASRNQTLRTLGSAHHVGLHLRGRLPAEGKGCGPCPALL